MQDHLRYSPVNRLILPWSYKGSLFSDCSMPLCSVTQTDIAQSNGLCCVSKPLNNMVDTYTWERFLPEVTVGIQEPEFEIAANFVREAAIDFAKLTRCLQRRTYVELQPDVKTYMLEPSLGEQIIGVLYIQSNKGCCQKQLGLEYSYQAATQEITFNNQPRCGIIEFIVYSAPTEDACEYDVYLYDKYRRVIADEARNRYIRKYHFRDRELGATLTPAGVFEMECKKARGRETDWLFPTKVNRPGRIF